MKGAHGEGMNPEILAECDTRFVYLKQRQNETDRNIARQEDYLNGLDKKIDALQGQMANIQETLEKMKGFWAGTAFAMTAIGTSGAMLIQWFLKYK